MITSYNRTITLIIALFIIISLGITGYMLIEGWGFVDALYMTIITLTTTGFSEVHKLTSSGKIFTVIFLVVGFGTAAYILTTLVQDIIENQLSHLLGRRRMNKKIDHLTNHTVICGFGKIGKTLAKQLFQNKQPFVIIERDEKLIPTLNELGYLYLIGDATNDDILIKSNIKKAKCIVSVVHSDAENVFITLSSRSLNKDIHIISRMYEETAKAKLMKAGANRVISPYTLTSTKITQTILNPAVGDFLEVVSGDKTFDFQLADIAITEHSKCLDKTLLSSNLRDLGIIVVGIKKQTGELVFAPSPKKTIELGDRLIALGSGDGLSEVLKEQLA